MGERGTDGDSGYLPQVGVGNKYQEAKGYGVYTGVHLGKVRQNDIQTVGDGVGAMFQERKITQVSCAECGALVTSSSLMHHMEWSHGTSLPQTT